MGYGMDEQVNVDDVEQRDLVVIRRRGYFYRPNWRGYTASIHEAGRYGRDEAERHAKNTDGVMVCEVEDFL